VRLVYGYKGDIYIREEINVFLLRQRFGRYVQHFGMAIQQVGLYLFLLGLAQGRVEEVCHMVFTAVAPYQVYLVFHQGYQRRYNNGHALAQQRGQLVAQRFSAPCGHYNKSILARKDTFNNFFLLTLKCIEAKMLL